MNYRPSPKKSGLIAFLVVSVFTCVANAQARSWDNSRVFPKTPGVQLRVGDRKVPFNVIPGHAMEIDVDRILIESGAWSGEVRKSEVLFVDAAVDYFDEVLRRAPNDRWALQCRAMAHLRRREYDASMRDIQEAIRLAPRDALAYVHRALIWPQHKGDARRYEDYTTAISLDADCAAAYLARGELWDRDGENRKATQDYSEVIRLNPANQDARSQRARCWNDLKEYDKAIEDYDALIALDAKNCIYWGTRGGADILDEAADVVWARAHARFGAADDLAAAVKDVQALLPAKVDAI
jgi:predicted Zn-dependent protease